MRNDSKQLSWSLYRSSVLLSPPRPPPPPQTRPLRPTSTETKSSKMAQIHRVWSIPGNHALSFPWRDILSRPKRNIYTDPVGPPHTCTGTLCKEFNINYKRKMVRVRAPNSNRKRWRRNLMGHANTERLWDRDEQIRHRHQRQKRKKAAYSLIWRSRMTGIL